MLLDFRPHTRLGGEQPVDLAATIGPVAEALTESDVDMAKVRVVCDWVQYRRNFRNTVDVRPIQRPADRRPATLPEPMGVRDDDLEIALDVRRTGEVRLKELTAELLRSPADTVALEEWCRGSESCIWGFNALYWSALDLWEKATGRGYEQALPGGESDARNRTAAGDIIDDLFAIWDGLAARNALPEELFVVEIGVGNGAQAKVFLDAFRERGTAHPHGYYRRLRYLMCDYSPHVLDLAREAVTDHAEHVSSLPLDATRLQTALAFLRYKVFLIYISNVYDNLPTDEVAQLGGRPYLVETRAVLPAAEAARLAGSIATTAAELKPLVEKLLRLGPALLAEAVPQCFADVDAAVAFWRQTYDALRLEERYAPLAGLDSYPLGPGMSGELLRPMLEAGADLRVHVSNGAMTSFAESLSLLHPFGRLLCHDLFVTDVNGYRTTFRGPGKYDGSVVNWVNGPLLTHIGRRRGFDVTFEDFRHRSGGHIVTMTAQPRD